MQTRLRAKLYDDRLCQAHRGGNTLDESLGGGAVDFRDHRDSQHPLHHRRLHSVSRVLFHAFLSFTLHTRDIPFPACYILTTKS